MLQEISILPGRIRLRSTKLYYNKPLAKYITVYVDSLLGVKYCNANYITGSVLVEFDPVKIEYGLLKKNIEKAISSAVKNGIKDLERFDAYYEAIEMRDSARRHFILWSGAYVLLKIKHILVGKFSLSSDLRILGIASAVSIIGSYPPFNRLYKRLTRSISNLSDVMLEASAILLTVLRESTEGVFVLILKSLNEYIKFSADAKSQRLLNQSMMKMAGMAWIITKEGQEVLVSVDSLDIGSTVIIHKGELIPVEGSIIEGSALVNCTYHNGHASTSLMSKGRKVHEGMSILAGEIKAKVISIPDTRNKKDISTLNLEMHKRVEKYQEGMLPYSIGAAVLIFILTGSLLDAMAMMLILAPSGAEVAFSTGIMSYTAMLSKYGIYLRNPNVVEKVTKTDNIIFDKSGTLTYGKMKILAVKSFDRAYDEKELLKISASCELDDYHPISITLRDKYDDYIDITKIESSVSIPSQGVKAIYDGHRVLIGNAALMKRHHIEISRMTDIYEYCKQRFLTPVMISIDEKIAGIIVMQDVLREDSCDTLEKLRILGIDNISILTGDSYENAKATADMLGIEKVYGDCSYYDKVDIVNKNRESSTVMLVGDGINDVQAMRNADVSISFASSSCDKVKLHSDCIIFGDSMERLPQFIYLSDISYKMIEKSIKVSRIYNITFGMLDFIFMFSPFTAKTLDTVNSLIVLLLNKRIEYLVPGEDYGCRHIDKSRFISDTPYEDLNRLP